MPHTCHHRLAETLTLIRAHLMHDLHPYLCTYEDCMARTWMFENYDEWAEHEISHRQLWQCPEHGDMIFSDKETYRNHLKFQPHECIENGNITEFIIGCSSIAPRLADRPCPICCANLGTKKALQMHIADHLERFALYALPGDVSDGEMGLLSRRIESAPRKQTATVYRPPRPAAYKPSRIPVLKKRPRLPLQRL